MGNLGRSSQSRKKQEKCDSCRSNSPAKTRHRYPEETALDAFKKMREFEIGRVLVLNRADPKKILA